MSRFFRSINLQRRILLSAGIFLAGLLLTQTLYFRYFLLKYYHETVVRENERLIENVQEDVDNFCRQIYSELSGIYLDTDFMNRLSEGNFLYTDRLYAHKMIQNSPSLSLISALYIYDDSHTLVSAHRKFSTIKEPYPYDLYGEDTEESRTLKEAIETTSAEFFLAGYSNDLMREKTVRCVMKLYRNRGTSTEGYIVCDISCKDLQHILERSSYKDGQYIWLESANSLPIYYYEMTSWIRKLMQMVEAGADLPKNYISSAAETSVYGCRAHILFPSDYLENSFQTFLRNVLIMVVLLILIWGSFWLVTSKKLMTQLTQMMHTFRQIEEGNMHVRFNMTHNDELGRMGEQFNRMMDEIENYIYREYESRIILNDARYYALQAQINPHFLFNTLSTMSEIANAENCPQVEKMCDSLSQIFRYNIEGNIEKKFVTLGQETEHIRNYLYIVEMRTMNHIAFSSGIPEEMTEILIPKLSLQPLVENAVNHGLRNKKGEKKIMIDIHSKEGDVWICVADNGMEADVEKIRAVMNNPDDSREHTSIGLRNIYERIRLLFGDRYGIKIENSNGMQVTIHIPLMTQEKNNEKTKNSDCRG